MLTYQESQSFKITFKDTRQQEKIDFFEGLPGQKS